MMPTRAASRSARVAIQSKTTPNIRSASSDPATGAWPVPGMSMASRARLRSRKGAAGEPDRVGRARTLLVGASHGAERFGPLIAVEGVDAGKDALGLRGSGVARPGVHRPTRAFHQVGTHIFDRADVPRDVPGGHG